MMANIVTATIALMLLLLGVIDVFFVMITKESNEPLHKVASIILCIDIIVLAILLMYFRT